MSTTASVSPPAAPVFQKETTAGNYFVSNYPPFSFWKPERVPELESAMSRPPVEGTPLGLYVHIPFCRKRCHFCYFKVYTDKDSAAIRGYLEAMLLEFRRYASQPFIGNRRPKFVYFGGGTPSYLSVEQLKQLFGGLQRELAWDEVEEVTFECEPGTLTDHKLKAIRELGVTRLSLGVENFDDHILEINGRAHHGKEIVRAYEYARSVGFPQINIDLIAGMIEETEANWQACVRRALELAPDSITIYEMEIPYNTTIYQRMKAEGKLVAPVADWETKRRWVHAAFEEFERAGYTVASAYTAVRDKSRTRFVYRDELWRGADLALAGGGVLRAHRGDALPESPRFRSLREGAGSGSAARLPRAHAHRPGTVHSRIHSPIKARARQPRLFPGQVRHGPRGTMRGGSDAAAAMGASDRGRRRTAIEP